MRGLASMMREADVDLLPSVLDGSVLHVAGRLTDAVFSFLGPATAALASRGVKQQLLLLDDSQGRALIPRLHPSIQVTSVRYGHNPLRRWGALGRTLDRMLKSGQPTAVHLHGLLPSLICWPVAHELQAKGVQVYVSPHHSRSLGVPLLKWLARAMVREPYRAIVNVPHDGRALERLDSGPAELIESPVADAFFLVHRQRPARHPLVVGSGVTDAGEAAARFAQVAVLLADQMDGLAFNWLGSSGPAESAQLEAAQVAVHSELGDAGRAEKLAAGWVYVASGAGRGFPLQLAEAMAAGLPCVVLDVPAHRDMIEHDQTGLLCADTIALMQAVVQLVEDPALRERLGAAARSEAHQRFRSADFNRKVIETFGARAALPPAEAAMLRD